MNNYLYVINKNLYSCAENLARFTQALTIVEDIPQTPVYLLLDNQGLALINHEFKPLYVKDIYAGLYQRARHASSELLIQAIKLKPSLEILILDLTAGLGKDSGLIASSGYKVLMVERNPILATILHYALLNNYLPAGNLQLIYQDAMEFLNDYQGLIPDVIYLDPMFKEQKVAKAKKEMQLIQSLIINEEELDNGNLLFSLALQSASKKVIVKRDNKQPPISQTTSVSYVKQGKTVRYDVYTPRPRLSRL